MRYAKKIKKMSCICGMQKSAKIDEKSAKIDQNQPKSIKMQPKSTTSSN